VWDPVHYLRFADERARPFHELVARIGTDAPREVVDLGCGPATLTTSLLERWPDAHVTALDSSPEMVERAREHERPGRLDVALADLRDWRPARLVDVLVTNATLQWVPGHLGLLSGLVDVLSPGGCLALQVPGNFGEPSHVLLRELAEREPWRARLADVAWPSAHDAATYLETLTGLGLLVDAWETTYLHVLPGDDAVLDWISGTGARPVLTALTDDERDSFLAEYRPALRAAYPRRDYGTVLPFRRVFAVARRPA
jgi:trans-aconitate 2-methyltransferase